eukprot:CAMPEP_0195284104 /NCGR_PEP_ID=MMETSP0707-20130614/2426_1 /TAXON_ID=33640 /ORGANISM="Asterionellopsis glacialis, Strain CCMP134" /LENGTH=319 /DNA_ID=CAMNT_0040343399 /DNA_START=238 /DNA_END=1197 /DNA_ORIENTATION=+
MNDRLGDIQDAIPAWAVDDDDEDNNHDDPSNKENGGGGDIEMGEQNKTEETPKYMTHFFNEIDGIKGDIDAVKDGTKRIGEINEEALQATSTAKEAELSDLLQPLINKTNKKAKRTKTLLGLLKEENEKLKESGEIKASDLRIRENLINTLTRKFIDEMKLYQNAQQKYKQDIKNKVARQVKTIKPDATEEEVEAVMRSEGGRDALYKEKVLAGGVNDSINTAYAKTAGKYADVMTLENSVAELHQMFLDFALLTEQQGELLDQIEFQVKSAGDYIEDANVDLNDSIEYQKKIRKKHCMIIIIVFVCTIILLFALGIIP